MSDALNYLVKVRPEAMTSYFTFLKKAGDHLDVRTRDLIPRSSPRSRSRPSPVSSNT